MNTKRLRAAGGTSRPPDGRVHVRLFRPLSMAGIVVLFSLVSGVFVLSACGGDSSDGVVADQPVTIILAGPNAVSACWNEIASTTVNVPVPPPAPEEQRPNSSADLATLHVAIYDAVMAIVGTHQPYSICDRPADERTCESASWSA
jgi:hypothetical protein